MPKKIITGLDLGELITRDDMECAQLLADLCRDLASDGHIGAGLMLTFLSEYMPLTFTGPYSLQQVFTLCELFEMSSALSDAIPVEAKAAAFQLRQLIDFTLLKNGRQRCVEVILQESIDGVPAVFHGLMGQSTIQVSLTY